MMTVEEAAYFAEKWLNCNKHIRETTYCVRHPECTGCKYDWKYKELEDAMRVLTWKNVVEVTFCKHCYYWDPDAVIVKGHKGEFGICKYKEMLMPEYGFCSNGE